MMKERVGPFYEGRAQGDETVKDRRISGIKI